MKGNSLLLWVTASRVGVDTITWTPAELHPVRSDATELSLYVYMFSASLHFEKIYISWSVVRDQWSPNWGLMQEKVNKCSLLWLLWCHSEDDLWPFKYKMSSLHLFILSDIYVIKKCENYHRKCWIIARRRVFGEVRLAAWTHSTTTEQSDEHDAVSEPI